MSKVTDNLLAGKNKKKEPTEPKIVEQKCF